jgi:hypothetical protein
MRNTRTLRGTITATGGKADKQLILNDQLINRGLRITGFFVWPAIVISQVAQSQDCNAILSYAQLPSTSNMDAADNRQIGWAFNAQGAGSVPAFQTAFSGYFNQLIDPDHIINRDLFLTIRNSTSDVVFNYLIVCELTPLTNDEAIITIIKENSQSIAGFQ